MSKKDVTSLIERLEKFEQRAGVRLEALSAFAESDDDGEFTVTVRGEAHSVAAWVGRAFAGARLTRAMSPTTTAARDRCLIALLLAAVGDRVGRQTSRLGGLRANGRRALALTHPPGSRVEVSS